MEEKILGPRGTVCLVSLSLWELKGQRVTDLKVDLKVASLKEKK